MLDYTKLGIAAAQAGDRPYAHVLLTYAIEYDSRDEVAWLWLSGVVETDQERRHCLEQVLAIDPQNTRAQRGLALLDATQPPAAAVPTDS